MDIKTALREGGVIGAGGAGFPAYAKQNPAADLLLINGAECEPLVPSRDMGPLGQWRLLLDGSSSS